MTSSQVMVWLSVIGTTTGWSALPPTSTVCSLPPCSSGGVKSRKSMSPSHAPTSSARTTAGRSQQVQHDGVPLQDEDKGQEVV
jgi:hypothetical protein